MLIKLDIRLHHKESEFLEEIAASKDQSVHALLRDMIHQKIREDMDNKEVSE